MSRPGGEQLRGSLEVDEAYIGGAERNGKLGRGTANKAVVVIAVEVFLPREFGRVRMQRIADVSGDNLIYFIYKTVETGSEINKDGGSGYNNLSAHHYLHKPIVVRVVWILHMLSCLVRTASLHY
jgi:hypothetical protein